MSNEKKAWLLDLMGEHDFTLPSKAFKKLVAALAQQPQADEVKDAQRYRWIRKNSNFMHCNIEIYGNGCEISDTLDEAIDAAMQKETQ